MAEDSPQGIVAKAKAALAAAQRRSRLVDHAVNMVKHYGNVQGNVLAGAVTYFGFLSFFPIMALAFAVIGYIARDFPNAEDNLIRAIEQVFPGIVTRHGTGDTISMDQIKNAKVAAGIIGLLGLLYAGLGWVSGLRQALQSAFQLPPSKKYNFLVGKGVDLAAMLVLGLVLIVSVAISTVVKGLTSDVISTLGLTGSSIGSPVVWTLAIVLGLGASTLLFFVIYRLLGASGLPARRLWAGALVGAAGFEVLKLLVVYVLGAVGGSPFAPLAIAITLIVWINYFSRLVMYGASWAITSGESAEMLALEASRQLVVEQAAKAGQPVPTAGGDQPAPALAPPPPSTFAGRFDPGSAVAGAFAAAVALVLFWRQN